MATGSNVLPPAERDILEMQAPDFRTRLDFAETANVIFPLSKEAAVLLAQFSGEYFKDEPSENNEGLVVSLERLIWESPKLWESPIRGVVIKCNDEIVAKVIVETKDYTEYTSMQFLAERAPDIPVPRPHGLIAFGSFRVILMSYIPDTTLTRVWPSLSHEARVSIQEQLEVIFCRLRSLRQDEGKILGAVCGEGAKALRVDECTSFKGITTTKEFTDLQFSARHHGSNTYSMLLRSLLDHDDCDMPPGSVFTHGDVRTANIMVVRDSNINGHYTVTGIIDWENSGFYPAYYECTTLTRTLSLVDEEAWYLYLPQSIAPSKFPIRWLVDRLWGIHVRST